MAAHRRICCALIVMLLATSSALAEISTLMFWDPYPVYTTKSPYNLLTVPRKNAYRTYGHDERGSIFVLSGTGFYETATIGKDVNGGQANLGSLRGPWGMLGLFYDPAADAMLQQVLDLPAPPEPTTPPDQCYPTIANPAMADGTQKIGFFDPIIQYQRYGGRFELECALPLYGFGLRVQTGLSSISQTVGGSDLKAADYNDLTCKATGMDCKVESESGTESDCYVDAITCDCKNYIMTNVMQQRQAISDALCLNTNNSARCMGAEDTRLSLFWREVFPVSKDRLAWPFFFFMPFLSFDISVPTGKKADPNYILALPLGNNGHFGMGVSGGISLDFLETVEIVFEGNITHFFEKMHCNMPVQTNDLQYTLFPRKADVALQPGLSWNFAATLNSYHFLDNLSFYAQYTVTGHCQDEFNVKRILPLCTPPPEGTIDNLTTSDVKVETMSINSSWISHLGTCSFTYDIAPWAGIGLGIQFPLSQRNAYRTSTLFGSMLISY